MVIQIFLKYIHQYHFCIQSSFCQVHRLKLFRLWNEISQVHFVERKKKKKTESMSEEKQKSVLAINNIG